MFTPRQLNIPQALASLYACRNTDKWDDLVSVGYVTMVRSMQTYDPVKGASLDTHLFGCVRYSMLKHLGMSSDLRRQRKARVWDYACPLPADGHLLLDESEDTREINETCEFITSLLAELSEEERELIERRYYDGLTVADVARERGHKRERVSFRYGRIIEKLRKVAEAKLSRT